MKATPSSSPPPNPEPTPTPVPEPTPSPEPAKTPESPVLTWPAWHAGADWASALLVLVGGFLAASFVARNSDVWLHLAAGRGLVTGTYSLGTDPFAYTTAGRPWVDANWLYELGAYLLYTANPTGGALIAVKAAAFAGAFGLLFLIRRAGQAVLPWVVFVGLGVMATAPAATLRPVVASMLFLSSTLVILFATAWEPGKWKRPAMLAGLFAVWANVDAWCILGPLTVGLTLLGEVIQRNILAASDEPDDGAMFTVPAIADLKRTFFLGLATCLLNPTFLIGLTKSPTDAVSQLVPAELGFTLPRTELSHDRDLFTTAMSPLSTVYLENAGLGYNLNGLAAVLILVGGGTAIGAGYARVRASHVVLWAGFVLLALWHYRLIPYFAIVAVPLAASHLNAVSSRVRLTSATDTRSRIIVTASGIARIVTVTAAFLMVAVAYPGWLHSQKTGDPSLVNRVEWAVEADAGLVRAAKILEQWRADGKLPETDHGLNLNVDFGNVCAWFAPREKVFVDSRYGLHRDVLPDLLRVRQSLFGTRYGNELRPPDAEDANALDEVTAARKFAYVTVTAGQSSNRQVESFVVFRILADPKTELWHLDGRSAFIGLVPGAVSEKLAFNPICLAFGPGLTPLPDGPAVPVLNEKRELFDEYAYRPKVLPPDADDAIILAQYADIAQQRIVQLRPNARAAVAGVPVVLTMKSSAEPPPTTDEMIALSMLILRDGRRAVAEAPDRPEGYLALATAYRYPSLPVCDERERTRQKITAMARFLARLPGPDAEVVWRKFYIQEGLRLIEQYLLTNQIDLALGVAKRLPAYVQGLGLADLRQCFQETVRFYADETQFSQMIPFGIRKELGSLFNQPKPDDKPEKLLADAYAIFDKIGKAIETNVARRNDDYEQQAPRANSSQRFVMALERGLPGKAIELYSAISEKDREANPQILRMIELYVNVLVQAGRIEDAAEFVDALAKELGEKSNPDARMLLRGLQFEQARIRGSYRQAAELWVELRGTGLPKLPASQLIDAVDAPQKSLASGALGGFMAMEMFGSSAIGPLQQLNAESNVDFVAGILALTDGNVNSAKKSFEAALRPQGVPLGAIGQPLKAAEIERYLRLIREAAK